MSCSFMSKIIIGKVAPILFACLFATLSCTKPSSTDSGLIDNLPQKNKEVRLNSNDTLYIVSSQAGIPRGVDFPRGGIDELKPALAFLVLEEKGEDLFDLSINYQFVTPTESIPVSFRIMDIPMKDKQTIDQEGLSGEFVINGENTAFEDISIQGCIGKNLVVEGMVRSAAFHLEISSMTTNPDETVSHTIIPADVQYLTCWAESILNDSDKTCDISLSTEGETIQVTLAPGEIWEQRFYCDRDAFWGEYCTQVDISVKGGEPISITDAAQLLHVLDDEMSPFCRNSMQADWYLTSTFFGALYQFPYIREQLRISL